MYPILPPLGDLLIVLTVRDSPVQRDIRIVGSKCLVTAVGNTTLAVNGVAIGKAQNRGAYSSCGSRLPTSFWSDLPQLVANVWTARYAIVGVLGYCLYVVSLSVQRTSRNPVGGWIEGQH